MLSNEEIAEYKRLKKDVDEANLEKQTMKAEIKVFVQQGKDKLAKYGFESYNDIPKLKDHPEQVYAAAYDIVVNGYEAGGGSLRIYDQNLQKQIFELLGFTEEDIQRKFGFFVNSLKYGTPPHGGLAFGLDRWAMILGGTDNIRDVIAFPKNLSAVCPMSNAPLQVDDAQLEDLGIQVKEEYRNK